MLYRSTDKTEATEIVIIDSQMNYRGKLDTYERASPFEPSASLSYNMYKSMDEALFSCKEILIFLPY